MQRLIDQPRDQGDVLEGGTRVGRVHYHLSVYQHFSEVENEPVHPSVRVEGQITPLDDFGIVDLCQRRAELTLCLADGRLLDFSITDEQGTIRSTGRGLYR